jgi:hypothetical protein
MIDNFPHIPELLDFSEKNTFYFIQILKRRKENPDMKTGVRVVDNFYIYAPEDLEKLKDKIVEQCTLHNARAYINVNRLDLERIALHTSKKIMELVIQGDYKAVKNAYPSVCGSHSSENDKRWVVDIDTKDLDVVIGIVKLIEDLQASITKSNYKVLKTLETKNGYHIITNPFNLKAFKDIEPNIDVHKSSPTILYIP